MKAVVNASLLLTMIVFNQTAYADGFSYFDFNDVPVSKKKKTDSAAQIESYLEAIYGADVTVRPSVRATNNLKRNLARGVHLGNSDTNPLGILGPTAVFPDTFLMSGKGKNPGIVITFGEAPIHSFAVDWQLFRKARGLTIKADGKIIFEQALSKAESKMGMLGHQEAYFFDDPVHTLDFIGWKKSKFGIDNLVVNFPLGGNDDPGNEPGNTLPDPVPRGVDSPGPVVLETPGGPIASIPEPATFLLLGIGLLLIVACKRLTRRAQAPRVKRHGVREKSTKGA